MSIFFVIASKAKQSSAFLRLSTGSPRRQKNKIWFLAMTIFTALSACAYQAPLKTPSEMAQDEVRAKDKAAETAKRAQKRAERDAKRAEDERKLRYIGNPPPLPVGNGPAPSTPVDMNEVSVPMGNK